MIEENTDRTLYDGRQQFHKRLDKLWGLIYGCLADKNYFGAYSFFNDILIESSAYINGDEAVKFCSKLDNIFNKSKMLNNGKRLNSNIISDETIIREFRDLSIELRQATKRLYLPIEEFDTEFDEEKFLKESEG